MLSIENGRRFRRKRSGLGTCEIVIVIEKRNGTSENFCLNIDLVSDFYTIDSEVVSY